MALVPGEYVFECLECNADGSISLIVGPDELESVICSHCRGEGVVYVDEEDAADRIDCGHMPLRAPST